MRLRPLAQKVAQRHEATVGNVVGHRVLVYFGYPHSHEDDASRAVRAALDLIAEAADHLGGATAGEQKQAGPARRRPHRPGRRLGQPEHAGAGGARHHARRGAAAAGGGRAGHRRASARRRARWSGAASRTDAMAPLPPLGGVAEPFVPYRVREASGAGDDLGFDLAPLVGRARELDQLTNRWEQARGGVGQAVLLSGEPGHRQVAAAAGAARAGRSRARARARVRWLSMHGSAYTQNTPLHPVVTLLRRLLASQPGETPAEQLDGLLRTFALTEALPLFASLLDLPQAAQAPSLAAMPPERQREETLEALVALVLAMTEVEPVILLVEDLHWLDATTLDLARAADRSGGDGAAAAGDDDPAQHPRHPVGIAGPASCRSRSAR